MLWHSTYDHRIQEILIFGLNQALKMPVMVSVFHDFGFDSLGLTKEDFLKENYVTQIGYPPLRID
ncbi:MAG: hypothetical protein JWQ84_1116, partial [Mucilaginibacter sp.]|nr:hypothetical protein [Mucilaginibacter sp.]